MARLALTQLDAAAQVRLEEVTRQCFGGTPADTRAFFTLIGAQDCRVLRRDDEVVAGLGLYRMGLWLGGRSVPLAGVAAVGVPPEERGRGLARTLVGETLRELRAEGVALSALYASTERVYRAVGYEQAGSRYQYRAPIPSLAVRAGDDLALRPIDPKDTLTLAPLYARWAAAGAGLLDRCPAIWQRLVRERESAPVRAYLAGDEGYVVYAQRDGGSARYDLEVRDFVALTPRALRRLWAHLSSHHTVGGQVEWCGPAVDPRCAVLPEQVEAVARPERWMLRLVDLPAALTARGYPEPLDLTLDLEVTDALLPENAGRWRLQVAGGRAAVEAGGSGDLRADVRGLAPLYTGLHTAAEIATAGLLTGDPKALAKASLLFAGPAPWMPDYF